MTELADVFADLDAPRQSTPDSIRSTTSYPDHRLMHHALRRQTCTD